jgi:hypothetical protein
MVWLHQEYRPPLNPGEEWWTDTPHNLSARLSREERAGRIVRVGRVTIAPGVHGAVVRRIRPRRPEWQTRGLVVAGCSLGFLLLLALIRLLLLPLVVATVLLALGILWGGLRRITGHRATCAGLHCPGCQH